METKTTPRDPNSGSAFERLRDLLREMFQLERGDLDFGLYRVMNVKAREIGEFLDHELLPEVKKVVTGTTEDDLGRFEKELDDTAKKLRSLLAPVENNPKVLELRTLIASAKADVEAEADVYSHLATFFGRYYREGDFLSLRRYSSGGRPTYLMPYDGEEVKLHWANADQYYIKTTENYASYAFTVGTSEKAQRVRFEIASADNEKGNIKEANGRQRRFVLARGRGAVTLDGEDLVARFEHRPLTEAEKTRWKGNGAGQQDQIDGEAATRILEAAGRLARDWVPLLAAPAPTDANPERTLLARHIERYTAKNSFDYFIHKDLSGFLLRELDLYMKTEVLNVDDLSMGDLQLARRALARMRAVRHIGGKIIAFLAQLEDFQKRLWLKKKFVLETQWCVTLDQVPDALYPEIATNEAQRREWVELLSINESAGDLANGDTGYSEPLNAGFLQAHPHLMLDTRHFNAEFKDRLLATLSDAGPLDGRTDGLLVHGENFQALNLLQERYGESMQCIYIDPPYNTGDSEILYKNGYLRSSWLSLMSNNLELIRKYLSSDSVFFISIDDFEMVNLAKLIDTQCPWLRRDMVVVNHHPQGGKATTLASTHEYLIACMPAKSARTLVGRLKSRAELRAFKRSGTAESNFRSARENSFYAILVHPESQDVVGIEPPPSGPYPLDKTADGLIRIYPIDSRKGERVWRRSYESCGELVRLGKLICKNGGTIYQKIDAGESKTALFSNWTDSRYNAGTHGANLLGDIIGRPNSFSYPKSLYTVEDAIFSTSLDDDACTLDFFAGSGTTGHAIINLNREYGSQRKYILVEMGDHFDTVMLPRLKKIVHAPDWKDGKPLTRERGIPQLIKYVRLESYEDALDGLVVTPPKGDLLAESDPAMVEDYHLRYALGEETSSSACLLGADFIDPFAYTLSVVRDGARRETPADLPETFNFLLGLRVESRRRIDGVLTIIGKNAQGQECLVIWRNLGMTDNDALERWFVSNRAHFPDSLDLVYANGDHTLKMIRQPGETWTAESIEPLFRSLMFKSDE